MRRRARKGDTPEGKFRHFMPGDPPAGGEAGPCWEWPGMRNEHGYGIFMRNGERIRAHRVAYEAHTGMKPGRVLRHTCDNPPCCNPAHLLPGTFRDNSQDMVSRGRSRKGRRHPQAKLDERAVVEMRQLHAGGVSLSELARRYSVSKSNVFQIVKRHTWTHI